jgi:long-chain fatty acid transport protein
MLRVGTGAGFKSALMATTAVAALVATMSAASAGGFAVREQSAYFQGMSFAGSAAGGALSSMFWNSAATASLDGLNTESAYTVVLPESNITVTSPVNSESGDIGRTAFVGATYGNYQLTKDIYLGMAVNAPFGLKTDPSETYFGAVLARKTELVTYNFNPTIAIRLAPWITVGAGVQIQSADGALRFATGSPGGPTTIVEGNGWGFGGTAGVLLDLTPTTHVGVGYRSQMDQDINGHIETYGVVGPLPTSVKLNLPDVVTLSLRQDISPVMRLAGTFEWTNWSRFQKLAVIADQAGATVLGGAAAGQTIATLPFNWSDGYFVSGGAEYDFSKTVTGRAGVGYEWSPVDSPEKRTPAFPDANRVWLSGGLSWQYSQTIAVDFAYTHIFIEDSSFARSPIASVLVIAGDVDSSVDIVSLGIKTHW